MGQINIKIWIHVLLYETIFPDQENKGIQLWEAKCLTTRLQTSSVSAVYAFLEHKIFFLFSQMFSIFFKLTIIQGQKHKYSTLNIWLNISKIYLIRSNKLLSFWLDIRPLFFQPLVELNLFVCFLAWAHLHIFLLLACFIHSTTL